MTTRKVFIVVKTYPTISEKYDELVCTAGILDDGSWVRIYPFPFRQVENDKRYRKYQWIELPLSRNTGDVRPESHKVDDIDAVKLIGEPVGTQNDWADRKKIICDKNPIFDDLADLIERAHDNELSLAIFKPTEILGLDVEEVDREWSTEKLKILEERARQLSLFQTEHEVRSEFKRVRKLPYKFSYRFVDVNDKQSKMMIEDWEIGALYWKCLERSGQNEEKAIELVRQKYMNEFLKKDLHLFLGTTKQYHGWALNPFVIVGVFYPPKIVQPPLF